MPWIKLYTEFIDDAKFASCSDSVKLRFIQLTLLAGECDKDGALSVGDSCLKTDQIAWRLRIFQDQLEDDIDQLRDLGVISVTDGAITVVNFDKRQGRSQSEKREQWKERQQRKRSVTRESRVTHADVTPLEKIKSKSKSKSKSKREIKSTPKKVAKIEATGSTTPRPRDLVFDAIAQITKLSPELKGSHIAKVANELRKVDVTPEQIQRFGLWWSACDYRGRRGDPPMITEMVNLWQRSIEWDGKAPKMPTVAPSRNGKTFQRGQAMYTPEMLAAKEREAALALERGEE